MWNMCYHSHKKRKASLETWAALIEISVIYWNLPSGRTHRGLQKKNMAFSERNELFASDFVLTWMKETLIWFNLQRDGNKNGLPNIKNSFAATNVSSLLKYVHCQDLNLPKLRIYSSKGWRKTSQSRTLCSYSYVANTASYNNFLIIQIFRKRCAFWL